MRTCSKCKIEKPEKEFYRDIASKVGFLSGCKECRKISKKIYRDNNKEKIAEYGKIYKKKRREIKAEQKRIYREENKEYFDKIRLEQQEISKQKKREAKKRYNEKYPMRGKQHKMKRRAALKTTVIRVTTKELNELIRSSQNICFWCDKHTDMIHIDHIYPLAKGGEHTINNLCVSCPDCNMRKGAKDPEVWLEEILTEAL